MSQTIVFWQDDFPFYDTLPIPQPILVAALLKPEFVPLAELPQALARPEVSLLVMPYGSAFPFDAWPAIYDYLQRGGNLLTLGGSPFEVPVYRQRQGFITGRPTVAYQKRLLINQAWPINSLQLHLRPAHSWLGSIGGGWGTRRCWSLMMRLSDEAHYGRLGSMGLMSAQIEPLLQGISSDGRVLVAPIVLVDHYHNRFAGGRWVLANFEAEPGFNGSEEAVRLFSACARIAQRSALQLDVRPAMATVATGETPNLLLHCRAWQEQADAQLSVRLENPGGNLVYQKTMPLPLGQVPQHLSLSLPAPLRPGLYSLHLRLRSETGLLAQATSGYYCRDQSLLRSGPPLKPGAEFFQRGDQPMPVIGTTYMAGRVHRQFLLQPNPALWRRDFAAMAEAGINFVRTGIWTGYEQVMQEPGIVREDILRAFEAYLHAAREHSIAVQFCFFAFQPEVFGRGNPYLDPEMRARQKEFIAAFVRRFRDVPDLSWDLINEPSQFDPRHLFRQIPRYDEYEQHAWNRWLERRYRSYESLLAAWNATPEEAGSWGNLRLPTAAELTYRQRWQGRKPLIANDWHRFAQEIFADWTQEMVATIRACGSQQMVTVGQDEGAVDGRPSPWFHHASLDHTCIHAWWLNDALLWDQLCATIPGKPLLVQETGIMQYEQLDEYSRQDEENRAHLLERKFALALATGAGFVQWLWNTNSHMNDDNEVAIGALRADGSEKPELRCTRLIAPFARVLARYAGPSELPAVAVIQTQSLLGSVLQPLSIRTTQNAVRALAYELGIPCRIVGENACTLVGRAKLIILPYPRTLTESAWRDLLDAVRRGATLLISGPMGDDHFHDSERLLPFGMSAHIAPITARECWQDSPKERLHLTYSGEAINIIDRWQFNNDASTTLKQLALGDGRILLAAFPVELNDSFEALASFYRAVLQSEEEIRSMRFSTYSANKAPGVLVWPRRFAEATLYTCISEAADPYQIEIRDDETAALLGLELQPERAALVLLHRSTGKLLAAYVHGRLRLNQDEIWPGGDASLCWHDGRLQIKRLG